MVARQAEISITWSAFEHGSAREASRFEDFGIPDTRRCTLCHWQGCSHVLLSFEDQAAHEALHHDHRFSTDSALLASENDGRLRLKEAPEDRLHPEWSVIAVPTPVQFPISPEIGLAGRLEPSRLCVAPHGDALSPKSGHSDVDQGSSTRSKRANSHIRELTKTPE